MSQVCQSPSGATCSGRASTSSQSRARIAVVVGESVSSNCRRCSADNKASECRSELSAGLLDMLDDDGAAILPGHLHMRGGHLLGLPLQLHALADRCDRFPPVLDLVPGVILHAPAAQQLASASLLL